MARIRLGDLLLQAGLIDEMQLQSAVARQRQWGGKLGDVLVLARPDAVAGDRKTARLRPLRQKFDVPYSSRRQRLDRRYL